MTLIKCPACGHTVLSVASLCPNCHEQLGTESDASHAADELVHCRKCGELMTRRARRCPHCRYAHGTRRTAVFAIAAVVLLVVAGGWFVVSRQDRPTPDPIAAELPPAAQTPNPPVISAPVEVETDTVPSVELSPEAVSSGSVSKVTRFALEWANIRAARGLDSDIIAILRPGQAVSVGDWERGWWGVYLGDSLVGYVAAVLMDTVPPQPNTSS